MFTKASSSITAIELAARIESGHGLGGLPNRFIWTGNANVPRHGFTYFHRYLLSLLAFGCSTLVPQTHPYA